MCDDLRFDFNFLQPEAKFVTPNVDKLAGESLFFERAYTQIGVCSPSRSSYLTGRRPDVTKVWNFMSNFRQSLGFNVSSLPQAFKKNGYVTTGMGKIFHLGAPANADSPHSWSDHWPYHYGMDPLARGQYQPCGQQTVIEEGPARTHVVCDGPLRNFADGDLAERAVHRLAELKELGKPWFFAVGFHYPHQPWTVHKTFWEQQAPVDELALAARKTRSSSQPNIAFFRNVGQLGQRGAVNITPDNPVPDHVARTYRRSHRACTTALDHSIGLVLGALKTAGLVDSTLVLFHSDHGWMNGELGMWGKQSNQELTLRTPLLVRVPWYPASMGRRTRQLVELVDLYPTLLELAGIDDAESWKGLQGESLAPLLADPTTSVRKTACFAQYPRCNGTDSISQKPRGGDVQPWVTATNNACTFMDASQFVAMGYSIRTNCHRYNLWVRWVGSELRPDWSAVVGEELYEHSCDSSEVDADSATEYENLAQHPDHLQTVASLKERVIAAFSQG